MTLSSSSSKPADTPADNEPDVAERSSSPTPYRERSLESSVSSSVSIDVSNSSRLGADKRQKKKKGAMKNPCNMSIVDEELMLAIRDNPVLWNVKMTDYMWKNKKDQIWEDQVQLMEKKPTPSRAGSGHCVTLTHVLIRRRAAMVPHT